MPSRLQLISIVHFFAGMICLLGIGLFGFMAVTSFGSIQQMAVIGPAPNSAIGFSYVALAMFGGGALLMLAGAILFFFSSSFIDRRIHPTYSAMMCLLMALAFPLGTIFGLLSLWALLDSKQQYASP
jgi:hypothetical protein